VRDLAFFLTRFSEARGFCVCELILRDEYWNAFARLRRAKGALDPHEDLRANCSSPNLCTDFRLLPICLSSN